MFKKKSVCTILLATAWWASAAMAAEATMSFVTGQTATTLPDLSKPQLVTGKPYSATRTVTHRRVLADGNEVVRETVARQYRDSAGRSRVETVKPDGSLADVRITGTDGVTYRLDPVRKLAIKSVTRYIAFASDGTVTQAGGQGMTPEALEQFKAEKLAERRGQSKPQGKSLPAREIEGLLAEGRESHFEIEAEAAGNLLPIKVKSESWMSKDLGLALYSRNDDPRHGETVMKLSGIERAEPDPALFVVPADFQLASEQAGVRPPQ